VSERNWRAAVLATDDVQRFEREFPDAESVRKTHAPVVSILAFLTLGSGIVTLYSLLHPQLPGRVRFLRVVFPFAFLSLSRFVTLVAGFGLAVSSINIYKRKTRAYANVMVLAAASVIFNFIRGAGYPEAIVSLALIGLLYASRDQFIVGSNRPNWRSAMAGIGLVAALAVCYGTLGFWLLDASAFGLNFSLGDALRRTCALLLLRGDPQLAPRTHHAAWFLDSLSMMSVLSVAYAVWSLFRPVAYRLGTHPDERRRAENILSTHGRSSLDYFKLQADKSLFFSSTAESVLAYRVGGAFAVVLGDPVGPDREIGSIVTDFAAFCTRNDWGLALYQTLPDFLDVYRRLGFKSLKLGDDAVVDLKAFSTHGRAAKELRNTVNRLERLGIRVHAEHPPLGRELLAELNAVAEDWQHIPGRRERQFALGQFDVDYVQSTPVITAADSSGRILAFVNVVPSYPGDDATIDLMRRRRDAPNGVMDFVLVRLIEWTREQGFARLSLGMAPMAGFSEAEDATREERAIHRFVQSLTFLFSFKGLRAYKAKFATVWEPRYVLYRTELDLPRLVLALARISETR
jgi:phosphatidylglycerol lysyltransferase